MTKEIKACIVYMLAHILLCLEKLRLFKDIILLIQTINIFDENI